MKTTMLRTLFLFLTLCLFSACTTGSGESESENPNKVHFMINPEDRKLILPVQFDDSITINMVFDTGGSFTLDSTFFAAHPVLAFNNHERIYPTERGTNWLQQTVPGLYYHNSSNAAKIGNTEFIFRHLGVYNVEKIFNNKNMQGIFNIPEDDSTHVWELNFEQNYLEIHKCTDFKTPDNCFWLEMEKLNDISNNKFYMLLPMKIETDDGDTLLIKRRFYIDTGMPWDIVLMKPTQRESDFFDRKKENAIWLQDTQGHFIYHTVSGTLFEDFPIDSLRIYTFDNPRRINSEYLIGLNFLKRFNVFFDMKNRNIGLQPIDNFQRLFNPNYMRFYWRLKRTPDNKFFVHEIPDYKKNPFKIAGFQLGDELIAMNGVLYKDMTYEISMELEKELIWVYDIIRNGEPHQITTHINKNEELGD